MPPSVQQERDANVEQRRQTLQRQLFERSDHQLYAVLDGASIPRLRTLMVRHDVINVCLFRGELDPELAQTAPYLLELTQHSPFTRLLLTQGLGNHWGILALSKGDLRQLRMHFRKFLDVWGPDGKPLFFRYYDPRVLRVYLPTCNRAELRIVFGPVSDYFVEAETKDELLRFSFVDDALVKQQLTLAVSESP